MPALSVKFQGAAASVNLAGRPLWLPGGCQPRIRSDRSQPTNPGLQTLFGTKFTPPFLPCHRGSSDSMRIRLFKVLLTVVRGEATHRLGQPTRLCGVVELVRLPLVAIFFPPQDTCRIIHHDLSKIN